MIVVAARVGAVIFRRAIVQTGRRMRLRDLRRRALDFGFVRACYRRVMCGGMDEILAAIQAGASGDELAALPIPESYRAAFVRRDETEMFEGVESSEKDPTKSIHIDDVPTPELAPDEVYLAVMA